jgi:hypothetical protein
MAYSICKIMKIAYYTLVFGLLALSGCDTHKPSNASRTNEITVEDLMWATEWKIYKWKINDLTDQKLTAIQVVVVGPDGQVAKEGPMIGYDSILDPDLEVSLAVKKVDADAMVKLRGTGSVSSTLKDVFVGSSWAIGPKPDIYNGLLVVATDSGLSTSSSKSDLAQNCNKLCLKLLPYNQKDADQATSSNR